MPHIATDPSMSVAAAQHRRIRGVIASICVPFHDDESIDYTALESQIDFAFESQASGVLLGMESEVQRLSDAERAQLFGAMTKLTRERGVVLADISAESTHSTIRFAREAQTSGVSAAVLTLPRTSALLEEEDVQYIEAVIQETSMPLVIVDEEQKRMSEATLRALYEKFPDRIVYIVEGTSIGARFGAVVEACNGEAPVLESSFGCNTVECCRREGVGMVVPLAFVDATVALWHALQSQSSLTHVYTICTPMTSIATYAKEGWEARAVLGKYLLKHRGIIPSARVRAPCGWRLQDESAAEIDRLVLVLNAAVQGWTKEERRHH